MDYDNENMNELVALQLQVDLNNKGALKLSEKSVYLLPLQYIFNELMKIPLYSSLEHNVLC